MRLSWRSITPTNEHAAPRAFEDSHGDSLLASASSGRRDALFVQLRKRTLVVRALHGQGMMLGFEPADGRELEQVIEKLFGHACAEYLHVHFPAPGCYAPPVERA